MESQVNTLLAALPQTEQCLASIADHVCEDVKHVFSPERLLFSLAYFGSLGLTLFFAVGVSPIIS